MNYIIGIVLCSTAGILVTYAVEYHIYGLGIIAAILAEFGGVSLSAN